MKCPFCAEVIQDEAILCRFCGATKAGAEWKPPASPRSAVTSPTDAASLPPHKSRFTIRTAAVFFLLSAMFDAVGLTSGVPLFGAVRGGAAAVTYHLIYVGLFVAMGAGLWNAAPWGLKVMLAGTIYYTLDSLRYLFDRPAREAYMAQQLQGFGDLFDRADMNSYLHMMTLMTVLFIACWWGFLLYLYVRRDYFNKP